jgi:hypothetical protein
MAAAFAVSFFTPFITSGLFANKGEEFLPTGLREIVHRVLQPEAAKREAESQAAEAKHQTESRAGAAKRDEETEAAAAKSDAETESAADKREAEKLAP